MSPNEQLPLAVFIHRALPKIVTEHLRVPPPGADQTLKQAQDAAGRRVDAMLDLVQPIVAHVDGLNVPTAITTLVLAAYEIALWAVENALIDPLVLNAMRSLGEFRRRQ